MRQWRKVRKVRQNILKPQNQQVTSKKRRPGRQNRAKVSLFATLDEFTSQRYKRATRPLPGRKWLTEQPRFGAPPRSPKFNASLGDRDFCSPGLLLSCESQ